jgi:hypothetical protein
MTFSAMCAALSVLLTRNFSKIFLPARRALEFSHGLGQNATWRAFLGHVRYAPESGSRLGSLPLPSPATSGHEIPLPMTAIPKGSAVASPDVGLCTDLRCAKQVNES